MKSEIEKRFEEKENEYEMKFGSTYPIFTTSCMTFKEHIATINQALKSGKPVKVSTRENLVY